MNREFLWGVATSAGQYESRLENDWTVFATTANSIEQMRDTASKGSPPAVVAPEAAGIALRHDNPFAFRQEIERSKSLGLNAYRLSLEWSRLEPAAGVWRDDVLTDLYVPVFRSMRQAGIEPVVTLHHLSNPKWVLTPPESRTLIALPTVPHSMVADDRFKASLRGWENSATVDMFESFVDRVVTRLTQIMGADAPHRWITINEPIGSIVGAGYFAGIWCPGFSGDVARGRLVYDNLLRAHVRAWQVIKRVQPDSKVGLAQNVQLSKPYNDQSADDIAAAAQTDYFYNWHSLNAWVHGEFDPDFQVDPAKRHALPKGQFFGIDSAAWVPTLDFIGLNYYRSWYVESSFPINLIGLGIAGGVPHASKTPGIESAHVNDFGWRIDPGAFLEIMRKANADYGLPLLVTENGMPDAEDLQRPSYLTAHANAVSRAVDEGIPVIGYLVWSITDNWEFQAAYRPESRLGLYRVDRQQSAPDGRLTLPRRPTESALAVANLAAGMPMQSVIDRYGSFTDDGGSYLLPRRSSCRYWAGVSMNGIGWRLVLGSLEHGGDDLWGWIRDDQTMRWVRLDTVEGDPSFEVQLTHVESSLSPSRRFVLQSIDDRLEGTVSVAGAAPASISLRLDPLIGTWIAAQGRLIVLPFGEMEKATPEEPAPDQPPHPYIGRWLATNDPRPGRNWQAMALLEEPPALRILIGNSQGDLSMKGDRMDGTFIPVGPVGDLSGPITFIRAADSLERPRCPAIGLLLT